MRFSIFLFSILLAIAPAQAADKLRVVASFSILADIVREIGGERIEVTALVGADGDAHTYQPKPSDSILIRQADLVVVNGLGFESWVDKLVKASRFKGVVTVASKGLTPLRHEEPGGNPADPHAWQNADNVGLFYIPAIRDALIAGDPAGKPSYEAAAARYASQVEALHTEIKTTFDSIAPEKRKVITNHDAFGYFGKAYGVTFLAPQGISTDSEASAADVAKLIRQIRKNDIKAVFIENMSDRRLIDQIARETGVKVGGALYPDALSVKTGPAATYLDMMRYNSRSIAQALR